MTTSKKDPDTPESARDGKAAAAAKEAEKVTTGKAAAKPHDAFPFDTDNPSGVPGTTEIYDDVVAAIAGHVAEEIDGVARLGTGGLLRAITGAMQTASESKGAGIDVEAGKKEAIFDLEVTVEYGHSIPDIVKNLRESIARELQQQLGLVAKEINVSVVAIEFPDRVPSGRVE